jgi:hypothetical protein
MRKSDKLKNIKKVNLLREERVAILKEGVLDNKFLSKKAMTDNIYKILKVEGVEGRYTDEYWLGVSKLKEVLNKYGVEYNLVSATYEHQSGTNTQLPNAKIYIFELTIMDKMGKQHVLPLRVNCSFVGRTGTTEDRTYELTYYLMV